MLFDDMSLRCSSATTLHAPVWRADILSVVTVAVMTEILPNQSPLDSTSWYQDASLSAAALTPFLGTPDALVVCGSGAKDLPGLLGDVTTEVEASDIPSWPRPSVTGHGSSLKAVRVSSSGTSLLVWVATGRVHLYDGLGVSACAHPTRAAALAGASRVILTNAAGSLNESYQPGAVVSISDHLNLLGANPLAGPQPPDLPRFVPLDDCYDAGLLSSSSHLVSGSGVYAAMPGPSYETAAEIRMLKTLGCDLVGMSTVPEAIAARQLGVRVAAFSVVSNMATGISTVSHDHNDVLKEVSAATSRLAECVLAALLA